MIKRRKPISLMDIGFEDAQRLVGLASKERHKNKIFAGIESTKTGVRHGLRNLSLVHADAFDRLKRMRPNSVKIMTADFLFTEFKINGKEVQDFGWRAGHLEKEFIKRRVELSKEVARVLVPNGRFVVIEYSENTALTVAVLKEAGFRCTVRPVPEKDLAKTKFLSLTKEEMEKDPEMRERVRPMQIIARKL